MPPKPFYEINPQAYLFGRCDENPEEKVRQWVLFELMSTYGIPITNLQIERPVKVGTRNHFADIVILRENAPYVVIECKKWEDKQKVRGMQQALSYADANTMKAKYAVYTNGDTWEVKRKMMGEWVGIPDLPKRINGDYLVRLDELINSITDFKPAFYWLNQAVPANSAYAYFTCLQVIFNGSSFPLNYLDSSLRFGTDLLLRVVSRIDDKEYAHGKMVGACSSFYEFLERRLGKKIYHDLQKDNLWQLTVDVQIQFNRLVEDTRSLITQEIVHIRFITALLHYLMKQTRLEGKKDVFIDVPAVLTGEFRNLIGLLFHIHLGVNFPDPVLEESCTDLRDFCSSAWDRFKEENKR